ncbi:nickel-dependent lactate racemase [Desulfosporosinus sp. PR]|uniref:nickel-dependent lactate racemase n=1 Tax=Candidatus Desulfosporosinus nitrosoreducens TaxID=3401928 RepID=UPI0027FB1D3D|nr:nickel-dependent lactate racemase [Desulfosporosinus sp. PR]MDQ7095696.1 nickel-dependent lactate racemase [Desulfosporosinus sp. PR]
MKTFALGYGDTTVEVKLDGARSVQVLTGESIPPVRDFKQAFLEAVGPECIESPPLGELIFPADKVTVVISDITRFWMRQDQVCAQLIPYLHDTLGVPYENIVILIALGTHRPQTEDEMKQLVTPEIYEKVKVVNHDCLAPDLEFLGVTTRGTRVFVNPLAVGRKVILIGGTIHHLMAGYGGGRKNILPGICGKTTITQNHIHSLSPTLPRSNPLIGMGILGQNPVNEDMNEVAAMVAPVFGINVVMDSQSGNCRLFCGHFLRAWEESCRVVQQLMGIPIRKKADVVVVSCGGYPKDINLYQAVKAMINAAEAVKEGGRLIFLAECREGGGAPSYFSWIDSLRRGTLDADLRRDFTIAGYIFYASCEAMAKAEVLMLTRIPAETLDGMGARVFADIDDLLGEADFKDKDVYVMPYGGYTVPYLKDTED